MVLEKKTYVKKYIGNINESRTATFRKTGLDFKKYKVKPTNYIGISKIIRKEYNDTTGYIVNGKVHSARSSIDRAIKSKSEPWER